MCDVKVTYDDVALTNSRVVEKFSPILKTTRDEKLVQENVNRIVAENIALFESAKLLDQAMTQIDQRNYKGAQESIEQNIAFLKSNVSHSSSKRSKKQMLNVVKYSDAGKKVEAMSAPEVEEMQKDMKFKNYLQKKKK